jgi:2-polyprenyl-3-methyl-5-hydroxy-6-metoxy-1,4-benzoquinol methylase
MNRRDFRAYRKSFQADLRGILADGRTELIDEQALPSYTHRNRLMSWLFWERIRVVIKELERGEVGRVLDFGCGAGVLLPILLRMKGQVSACDLDLTYASQVARERGWRNIDWRIGLDSLKELAPATFDTIICLDVLEHVDSLPDVVAEFVRLLKPGGRLIVSGPTESILYRAGRRLAGFSGHYHVRDIYEIERYLSRFFRLSLARRLVWPITLFRITVGRLLPVVKSEEQVAQGQ